MTERLYSARAAAPLLHTTERTVRRWVDIGKLAADRDGTTFQIPASAIAQRAIELGIELKLPNGTVEPLTGELHEATPIDQEPTPSDLAATGDDPSVLYPQALLRLGRLMQELFATQARVEMLRRENRELRRELAKKER